MVGTLAGIGIELGAAVSVDAVRHSARKSKRSTIGLIFVALLVVIGQQSYGEGAYREISQRTSSFVAV